MIGYHNTWVRYEDKMRSCLAKEEDATPESLRAAAKVLEEKAKELDKPKLTKGQQKYYDKICAGDISYMSRHIVALSDYDDKGTWLTDKTLTDMAIAKNFCWDVGDIVSRNTMQQEDGTELPLVKLSQSYHGTYTAIDWNRL